MILIADSGSSKCSWAECLKNGEIIQMHRIQHFFNLHIKCFDNYKQHPLTFVGSGAYYLQKYISEIAKNEGLKLQEIVQSPIENLVKEHFLK